MNEYLVISFMLDIVVMELKIIFLACKLYACSPLCGVASFIKNNNNK